MRILKSVAAASLLLAAAPQSAMAQDDMSETPEPTLVPTPIAFGTDGLSGEGATLIRDAMTNSQFVMLGEAHGFAQAPMLLGALGVEGREAGFTHYAVEAGPISTVWLSAVLADGGADALAAELADRPLAIPFLNMREEADAAIPFLAAGGLWGIDQEFIGSMLLHLPWLVERAPNDAAKTMAEEWLASEREAFATGNQGAVMMMAAEPEDWASLASAFAGDGDAVMRIETLAASSAIYRHFLAGKGLDNNLDRIELLKATFLNHYHAARAKLGAPPRVLFKMGALHAGRSTSSVHTFDIGSLVEGMAAANQMDALHIAYLPLGGKKTSVQPSPDGMFSIGDANNEKLEAALVAGGVDVAAIGDDHSLIALDTVRRNLGNGGLGALDQATRFIILGFDYLVTTRGATAATPLAN